MSIKTFLRASGVALSAVLLLTSAALAADSKVLNIGWTGGSGWTALPTASPPKTDSSRKKASRFAMSSSKARISC